MSRVLKVGVVGAGVFAGYHANKVAGHPRAVLTGVFDRTAANAEALASKHNVASVESVKALAELSDALIVAVPASHHTAAALQGLEGGCHLLVEKPLACTVLDATLIRNRAQQQGQVLQVGHQERIVMDAIGLGSVTERPTQIDIIRHTPRATRNLDTSVVMDLMVHDLDLLQSLYGSPDWISTEAARRVYSNELDVVRAELGYGDMTAYLSASRDGEGERRWVLRYPSGTVEIDFGMKTLRHDTGFSLNENFGNLPEVQDNLGAAFDYFVRACLDAAAPLASGDDGIAAVKAAAEIEGAA